MTTLSTRDLFYEDFHVGQTFESGATTMHKARVVAFASEFDPQPQHVSDQTAASSLFGTLVASGWHTAAVTMRLQLEAMLNRIPGGAQGAQVDSLVWRRPVHPGDSLHVSIEVKAMRPSRSRPDRGLLTLYTSTVNQHEEQVLEMTAAVVVPRKTPSVETP